MKYFALLTQFIGTPNAGEIDGNEIVGLGRVMYVSDVDAEDFDDACEQVAAQVNMKYLSIPKGTSEHIKNDLSVVYEPDTVEVHEIIDVYRSNEWGGEKFWTVTISPMPEPIPANDPTFPVAEPVRDEDQEEQKQEEGED